MNMIAQSKFAEVLQKNWNENNVPLMIMKTINELVPTSAFDDTEVSKEFKEVNATVAMNKIRAFNPSAPNLIQLVLFGEDHTCEQDHDRGQSVIDKMKGYPESLVVFERGMEQFYNTSQNLTGHTIIREDNLYANPLLGCLRAAERSQVMAGYLVACIARMSASVNVVLFYGENHKDILERYFDYYARHTNAITLLNRNRMYFLVRSLREK